MKTLFVSHYKEGTGWSKAAIDSILALNTTGENVVCRNIKLSSVNSQCHPALLMLESKDLNNIDVCIQNVLPHHMVGTQKFKRNIGYFVAESNTTKYNHWLEYLSLMDRVWVPNHDLKISLINDGISADSINVVPYAFNINRYTANLPRIDFGPNDYKFKFYFIGDLNDRKNLSSIIRCFHSEFEPYEPVALVLKVKKFGINPQDLFKHVTNICNLVKQELRMYRSLDDYHKEIIISQDMDDDGIYAIHNSCDCYVGPTHGEGWSIPAFEAMALGKTPICSNEGGPKDFILKNDAETGYLVNGNYDVCNHSDPAFPELFTGREEWFSPSESEIKKAMRFYYENRDSIDRKSGLRQASNFSYENVGKIMKEAIHE